MSNSLKHAGKASSIPGGMVISLAANLLITLSGSVMIANFINRERITWEEAGYWIMGMLFAASFIGGKCAIMAVKHQRIVVSTMSGMLYWGLLLCVTALFFGGNFSSIWETAAIILAGCGSAALITVPDRKRAKRKTRGIYR